MGECNLTTLTREITDFIMESNAILIAKSPSHVNASLKYLYDHAGNFMFPQI